MKKKNNVLYIRNSIPKVKSILTHVYVRFHHKLRSYKKHLYMYKKSFTVTTKTHVKDSKR